MFTSDAIIAAPWVGTRTDWNGTHYTKTTPTGEYITVMRNIPGFNRYATGWTFTSDCVEDDGMTRWRTAQALMENIDRQLPDWIDRTHDHDHEE